MTPKRERLMRALKTERPAWLSGGVQRSACDRIAQRVCEGVVRLICRVWCPLLVVGAGGSVAVRIGESLWPRHHEFIVLEARGRILALKGNPG
jgi:hypothetical protein